jgi:hypothetical protein
LLLLVRDDCLLMLMLRDVCLFVAVNGEI